MITIDKITQLAGHNPKKYKGTFGIEIETETMEMSDYPPGFLVVQPNVDADGHTCYKTPKIPDWEAKTDGSLRHNGIEFILCKPLNLEDAKFALKEFGEHTKDIPFLRDQVSTSVHVHINMAHETPLVLANYITVWFLFENLLLDYSGPTRRASTFARGGRHAEDQIETWKKAFINVDNAICTAFNLSLGQVKYAAMNIGNLQKLGSIEARSFRGSVNPDEIIEWIMILNSILEFSKTPGLTPRDFLLSYQDRGTEVLEDVFGSYSTKLKCDGYQEMMERNEKYVLDIVTCVSDWNTFGMKFESFTGTRKKPSSKKMDFDPELYNHMFTSLPEVTISPIWSMPTQSHSFAIIDDEF